MLLTAVVIILIFSLLVLIHELGHFLVAKRLGIGVEEFGFGIPPRIFGKKIGETIYSVNWLPLGGFVKLVGEETEELKDLRTEELKNLKTEEQGKLFFLRPKREKTIVLTAGVLMNFLLGVVVISFVFTRGVMVPVDRIHIERVVENSPAQIVGLQKGDILLAIDGKEIKKGEDLTSYTREHLGQEVTLKARRQETIKEVKITPRKEYPSDQGPMGVVISSFEEKKYPFWQAPIFGTWEALKISGLIVVALGTVLWRLVTLGVVPQEVAGPVGIAQLTSEVVKFGPLAIFEFAGLISLNLAVVNILPLPALDGGRLFFIAVEAISGKRVKPKAERIVHQVGFALLIILIVLITFNDVTRLLKNTPLGLTK